MTPAESRSYVVAGAIASVGALVVLLVMSCPDIAPATYGEEAGHG